MAWIQKAVYECRKRFQAWKVVANPSIVLAVCPCTARGASLDGPFLSGCAVLCVWPFEIQLIYILYYLQNGYSFKKLEKVLSRFAFISSN